MVGLKCLVLGTAAALFIHLPPIAAAKAAWQPHGPNLVYSTPRYSIEVDAKSGAPKSLEIDGRQVLAFGASGWWRATFEDNSNLVSSEADAVVIRSGNSLLCKYHADKLDVRLRLTPDANGLDMRAYVTPRSAVVTQFDLPVSVDFSPTTLNEIDYPEELGRALKPSFFTRQPDDYIHWTTSGLGPAGAADVGVLPPQMLDYDGDPVPVTVTETGKSWLGNDADRLDGWSTRCPRPPQGAPDITLLNTPNGPLLSLQTVDGGWGWFLRWSGLASESDMRHIVQVTTAAAAHLWSTNPAGGTNVHPPAAAQGQPLKNTAPAQIGLIDLNHDSGAEREWESALKPLGCPVVDLHSPAGVLASLKAHDCWLMVNLGGETMPSTADDEKATAAAIREYIVNGGVWVHVEGAPFYYTVERQPYNSLDASYPPLFSDFLHVDSQRGQVSIYGIQHPGDYFVPARLHVAADPNGGHLGRGWITWIPIESGWTSPVARIAVGDRVDSAIRAYGVASGFTRPLPAKVPPAVLSKWKKSLLINYSGPTFNAEAADIARLPSPSLVHIWDYLHGGFDKQYPDLLPPNPNHGTPADFTSLFHAVHAAGDLMMPYTNPTWWCDGPPGPTFVRDGTAPLLVDRAGKNVVEVYGPNRGWALCAWHPEARAAEASILDGFTKQYPVDVLFQDQIGARSPEYDFNAAAPNPDTYTEGMRRIAERDGKVVPVGTENGFDGVMNEESEFCGVCWGLIPTQDPPAWSTLWRNRYAPGTWTFSPMALWLAHDKVLFAMHDLGQFDLSRETLVWTLAAGYELSAHETTWDLDRAPSDPWLAWLAALQKNFGPDIDGAPLISWHEPHPGVFRAQYGRVTVTANTTPAPAAMDSRTTLAPFGFVLVDAKTKATAGSVSKLDGTPYSTGLDFIRLGGKLAVYHPGR